MWSATPSPPPASPRPRPTTTGSCWTGLSERPPNRCTSCSQRCACWAVLCCASACALAWLCCACAVMCYAVLVLLVIFGGSGVVSVCSGVNHPVAVLALPAPLHTTPNPQHHYFTNPPHPFAIIIFITGPDLQSGRLPGGVAAVGLQNRLQREGGSGAVRCGCAVLSCAALWQRWEGGAGAVRCGCAVLCCAVLCYAVLRCRALSLPLSRAPWQRREGTHARLLFLAVLDFPQAPLINHSHPPTQTQTPTPTQPQPHRCATLTPRRAAGGAPFCTGGLSWR